MQIVIDIDEETLQDLYDSRYVSPHIKDAFRSATSLPKGHGRLIDVKELRQDIIAHKYSIDFCKEHHIDQSIDVGMLNILLADAPTIIEADDYYRGAQEEY